MTWLLTQTARDVIAVHVPVEVDAVAALLPPGVVPDTHEGRAWATVLAMQMVEVHPRWLPPVPGLSSFAQVAIRAFVRRRDGEQGVVFLALDVSSRFVAAVGRVALGLPYRRGVVAVAPGRVHSERWTASWAAEPDAPVDAWFEERNVLYAARRGRLLSSVVRHPTVPVTAVRLEGAPTAALAGVGLAAAGPAVPTAIASLPSHVWWPRTAPDA